MIGQTIGHYRIVEKLGGGGMGVVYLAEDTRLGRRVALKFLPQGLTADRDARERFMLEARAASALDHPNICTVHAIEETPDGQVFIAMAYYDGETLKKRIQRGPLPLADAVDIARQVAEGLAAAHANGIVHRDIKPANIILTSEGRAKIVDFGLAKLPEVTALTRTGTTWGTVAYMSPEQARGDAVDHRTDLWALGVVLFEMLSGRTPFSGDSSQVVMFGILNRPPETLTAHRSDIPPPLTRLVTRALEKDLSTRYQTAAQLGAVLHPIQQQLIAPPTSASREMRTVPSLAVLPFTNNSPDPEQEYFCDGMAEELIAALGALEGLRVASRTSSFQFKGQSRDIRRIGEELGVQAVLEGSVRKAANRIRVTAQITDVASGYQMWSERYDRTLDDVFEIQDEIARSIVEHLKVKLLKQDEGKLSRRGTDNVEAYQLYLKARFYWSLRHRGMLRLALDHLKRAIEIDPDYALAHAGIADCYTIMAYYGIGSSSELAGPARQAAERASRLDPDLAEAHHALASVMYFIDWNWNGATRELEQAVALNPSLALSWAYQGPGLAARGAPADQCLAPVRRAVDLEPRSAPVRYVAAVTYLTLREFEPAREQLARSIEVDPTFAVSLVYLAELEARLGNADYALELSHRALDVSGRTSFFLGLHALVLGRLGRTDDARRVLSELEARAAREYVAPTALITARAAVGDLDRAIEQLQIGLRDRTPGLPTYTAIATMDLLHAHPGFQDFARQTGIDKAITQGTGLQASGSGL
ncbi:MAG: protein kinase [Acidobacteria bacterium]|nr:protein kinase [Acidobacteriota bacterium]